MLGSSFFLKYLIELFMANLKQTFQSSLLLILLSASNKLVGLVSTLILARLLTPEDYGIVAIATLTFGLLEVMSKTGSDQYVITSSEVSANIINTAFTYNVIIKSAVALLFLMASPLIVNFYEDSRLYPIFVIFSVMLAFTGFQNPQIFLMKKNQKYGAIVKITVAAKLISTGLAIAIAMLTESYWALVIGQFVAYTLPIIGGYIIAPYRPILELSNIRNQFSFSIWLVPSSILGYFRTQIDTILVSRIFDTSVLGSYHVMKYLALMPNLYFIGPMTQPLLAQLSSIKDNKNYFSMMFNVSIIIAIAFSLPISQIFYLHSELIVLIVLGEQWVGFSELFSIFGIMVVFIAIFHQATNCFLIYSNTSRLFSFELISAIVIGAVLIIKKFDYPYDFAVVKILIEITLTLVVCGYVYYRFLSIKMLIRFICLSSLIVMSNFIAVMLSSLICRGPEGLVDLVIWLALYFTAYISVFLLISYLLKSRFTELAYIWRKISVVIRSTINKMNLRYKVQE